MHERNAGMKTYYVPKHTLVLVIGADQPWINPNFKVVHTRFDNTFTEKQIIIHPNCLDVRHSAKYAETVGAAYACMGYFAFRRDKHVCLVTAENVYVKTEKGMTQTKLVDFLDQSSSSKEAAG